jgi:hypothetical protein
MARWLAAALVVGSFVGACDVHKETGPGSLFAISVSPDPKTLAVNGTQQFTAVGTDFSGVAIAITPTWSVVSGGGAINGSGVFTAGTTIGTYTKTVMATSGGVTATATIIVTAGPLASIVVTPNPASMGVGATQQFTAVGKDAGGNVVAFTPTWSVVASGGTVNGTGLFTAGTVTGTFAGTVQASSGGISGAATVTVVAGPLASIVVTPNPITLNSGFTQQFSAVGKDANGNSVAITPVWSVDFGGGTIGSTGLFTAGPTPGTYTNTVKATSGGLSGTATVIVSAGTLASISVTPNPATVPIGGTQQFTAVGKDAAGNVVVIAPTWSVIASGGTIDITTGLFTAGAVIGTYTNTVKATSGVTSGTATVNVTSSAPTSLVNLGSAALNGIMAGTAVTCVNLGVINANVSISPGNTITGFGPCTITGVQHLNDAVAVQNQVDLTAAYNTLAGLPCPPANAIVANLGGTTKPAGVYCTASGIGVTGVLTLNGGGDPNATFVFQAGSGLTTAGDVILINGAQAKNVYWLVGSSATIGTASHWQGNIIALTSITLVDNATLNGRALARNGAVSLGTGNIITLP